MKTREERTAANRGPWWSRVVPAQPSSALPLGALAAFSLVLLLSPQTSLPALAPLHIALVTAVLAVVAVVVDRVSRHVPVFVIARGAWPALALGVWAVGTIPLSTWPGGSMELFRDLFVKSVIILCLVPAVVDTTSRLRWLLGLLCGIGALLAITGIRNFLAGSYVAGGAPGAERIVGYDAPLTGNPNDSALMLNLLLPLTLAMFHVTRRRAVRALLLVVVALDAAAILATFSRAGFLTLALVGVLSSWRSLKGYARVWGVLGIGGAIAVVALLPGGLGQHLGTVTDIGSDPTGSAQERYELLIAAAKVVAAHPLFGAGLGMNALVIGNELGGSRSVHNVYLQVAADLGLVGLALFVALVVGCLWHARTVAKSSSHGPRGDASLAPLATGIELSLVAFVFAGLFHPAAYHFYLYYVGGLALAVRAIHDRTMQNE